MTVLSVMLEQLATCLCGKITELDLPAPCYCGVLPGAGVAVDTGECLDGDGMAYVRLVNTYPSETPGVQLTRPGNCGVSLGFDLEVGMWRNYPIDELGNPIGEVDNLAVSRLQMADLDAMMKAISCGCWLDPADYVVGQYAPAGPMGGMVGGTILVSGWLA